MTHDTKDSNKAVEVEDMPSSGDRVEWWYTHHLNRRSKVRRVKYGWYDGLVNHRPGYRGKQLACVWFDGNKWNSSVPYEELRKERKQS